MVISLFWKIVVVVAVTHLARWIGHLAGPNWGGIILGLPISTALVLLFYAIDAGADFAMAAVDSGILGVGAAVGAAVAFVAMLARGANFTLSIIIAVGGYLAVAAVLQRMSIERTELRLLVSLACVTCACVAMRLVSAPVTTQPRCCSVARSMILRTLTPVVCLLTVVGLKDFVGPQWAGLLSTFPSTFLSVAIVTNLESGRRAAFQLGQSFPAGNFSMIAFLACFGCIGGAFGFAAGFVAGYVAAAFVLFALRLGKEGLTNAGLQTTQHDGERPAADDTIRRQVVEAILSRDLGSTRIPTKSSTSNLDTALGV